LKPTISVAVCTYNGEQFLAEQLDSILIQTVPVDEIIICDDCSKDLSAEIILSYQKKSAIPIHFFQNETNLGSSKNFEKSVKLCSGDLIFFADQDDIWRKDKVERMLELFEQNPNWNAVFSNAHIIDQDNRSLGKSSFEEIQFTDELQNLWKAGKGFEILLRGYVVTGATLAIRKEIVEKVFPTPVLINELIHDGWIAMYLSIFNQIGFTSDCLIDYRTHPSQQVGFGKKSKKITIIDRLKRNREDKLNRIFPLLNNSKILYAYFSSQKNIPPNALNLIKNRKEHFEFRYNLSEIRLMRIIPIIVQFFKGSYQQNEVGKWWRTIFGDLLE
jgi:glycosyltransferase involved in cell wall biosynthesis